MRKLARILFVAGVVFLAAACQTYKDEKYDAPPSELREQDFVGVWEVHYISPGKGTDRLTLRTDGTFKQEYDSGDDYAWETSWNNWALFTPPDGDLYLVLEGAKFFDEGLAFAESNGVFCPQPTCGPEDVLVSFYDPVSKAAVYPNDNLVLVVRSSANDGLVLKHLWRGFEDGISSSFFRIE